MYDGLPEVSVEFAVGMKRRKYWASGERRSGGMALFEKNGSGPLFIPVYGTDQVADVTGAGDTVIATFTLALAAGASYAEAAKLANYAGGIVVMKMGTATASNDELRHAIERDEELK